jgi:hypothetical protein
MKSYREELWFNIPSQRGFKNITIDLESALRESGIREGDAQGWLCQMEGKEGKKKNFRILANGPADERGFQRHTFGSVKQQLSPLRACGGYQSPSLPSLPHRRIEPSL